MNATIHKVVARITKQRNWKRGFAPRFAMGALPVVLIGLASRAQAQNWITYDAAHGTLPEQQCWTFVEQLIPRMAYPLEVAGGDLHFSTMEFDDCWPTSCPGAAVYWWRTTSIDFGSDFAVEARVKIIDAPNHSINMEVGWPRPGYTLAVRDVNGRSFWIGLGTSEIFLSNNEYGQYGSADTVTANFNTTDDYHVYRIERAAGGVGATLRIDGNVVLTLPALGPFIGGTLVYFGDGTFWANSDSLTSWVRFTGESESCCPADIVPSGGDGTVGVPELLYIINNWGPCSNPNACPADIAPEGPPIGDDVVGVPDLLYIINNWGPC